MRVTEGLISEFGDQSRYLDVIPVANPGAGLNATFPVPGDFGMRVLAASATLSTDANVANRLLSLDYLAPRTSTPIRNAMAFVVTAGTANQAFHWNRDRTRGEQAANTPAFVPLLDFFLLPAWSVRFTVDAIQSGDTLTSIVLYVQKFLTGAPRRESLEG